jgi:glycerol dehydrogenase
MSRQMPRSFVGVGHYLQGPGVIDLVGEKAATLGKRLAVICDRDVLDLLGDRLRRSFQRGGIAAEIFPFAGEVTSAAIDQLVARAKSGAPDVIAGVGGGRALDVGKGVAYRLRKPFVSVPTVASSDAPASRGIAIYDDEHRPVVVEQMDQNPNYVLVDTEIIAKAPARFLRSGIGDAISKKFEVEGSWAGGGITKHKTQPLRSAVLIANDCYRLLRTHGAAAMRAVEAGTVTDDLEAVVEAATLLSCLAFENGGLWVAHSVVRGLGTARGAKDASHGDQVAYGTLVQMTLEDRAEAEITDLMTFLCEVGLPLSLAELGLSNPTDAEIAAIAEATSTSPYIQVRVPRITTQQVVAAIRDAESRAARFARPHNSKQK